MQSGNARAARVRRQVVSKEESVARKCGWKPEMGSPTQFLADLNSRIAAAKAELQDNPYRKWRPTVNEMKNILAKNGLPVPKEAQFKDVAARFKKLEQEVQEALQK